MKRRKKTRGGARKQRKTRRPVTTTRTSSGRHAGLDPASSSSSLPQGKESPQLCKARAGLERINALIFEVSSLNLINLRRRLEAPEARLKSADLRMMRELLKSTPEGEGIAAVEDCILDVLEIGLRITKQRLIDYPDAIAGGVDAQVVALMRRIGEQRVKRIEEAHEERDLVNAANDNEEEKKLDSGSSAGMTTASSPTALGQEPTASKVSLTSSTERKGRTREGDGVSKTLKNEEVSVTLAEKRDESVAPIDELLKTAGS